jgi:hypothetical protein
MVVGYSFNLQTNELTPQKVANPGAGTEHTFRAWRLEGSTTDPVSLRSVDAATLEADAAHEEESD